MKTGLQNPLLFRYALALLGGALLGLAFPRAQLAGLAWFAPGLILMAALGLPGKSAFRVGYAGGLAHYLISLHWLLFIPFPLGAFFGWIALAAYLALYPALWVWLAWRVFPQRLEPGAGESFLHSSGRLQQVPLAGRAAWALSCAVLWVALEMVVARMFTGFPWNLLGASQYAILPVIQIASFTGIYGVSFLVVWFSVALALTGVTLLVRPFAGRTWFSDLTLPILALGVVLFYGVRQLHQPAPEGRSVRAVLIQPSIPQTLIWDPKENSNRFNHLIALSEQALQSEPKPQMLIWPEAAVPNLLRFDPGTADTIADLVQRHDVWMVLGADDAVPRPGAQSDRDVDYYNSSFLISPDGRLEGTYRKRRLVILGEYIPRWLPILKFLTPIEGSFAPGEEPVQFHVPDLGLKTSVLICFEDVFPHLAREHVEADTDFLLNLTNNGWFGESSAQWQHAASAVFRAVENRIPLVRSANNGLTCWVDPFGRMREVYFENTTDIYGAGYKSFDVPLLADGEERSLTWYGRQGDWFGWGCFGLALLLIVSSIRHAPFRRRSAAASRGREETVAADKPD